MNLSLPLSLSLFLFLFFVTSLFFAFAMSPSLSFSFSVSFCPVPFRVAKSLPRQVLPSHPATSRSENQPLVSPRRGTRRCPLTSAASPDAKRHARPSMTGWLLFPRLAAICIKSKCQPLPLVAPLSTVPNSMGSGSHFVLFFWLLFSTSSVLLSIPIPVPISFAKQHPPSPLHHHHHHHHLSSTTAERASKAQRHLPACRSRKHHTRLIVTTAPKKTSGGIAEDANKLIW